MAYWSATRRVVGAKPGRALCQQSAVLSLRVQSRSPVDNRKRASFDIRTSVAIASLLLALLSVMLVGVLAPLGGDSARSTSVWSVSVLGLPSVGLCLGFLSLSGASRGSFVAQLAWCGVAANLGFLGVLLIVFGMVRMINRAMNG